MHLVRLVSRSAYVVAEDTYQLYLRSHIYMRPRIGTSEESANDADKDVESGPVSTMVADTALTQQLISQVKHLCYQCMRKSSMASSIVRLDHGKLPRILSLHQLSDQLSLPDDLQRGQSVAGGRGTKSVRFFLTCEHGDSHTDHRDTECGGYETSSGISFDCCLTVF